MPIPKISVLMPVYNIEKYVGQAIESILNQSFDDFEFIIIDDGSTDQTKAIVQSYQLRDARIVFSENPVNIGVTATLNKGLTLVRGEYIARMDGDDVALPERFQRQLDYLEQHPQVGLLGMGVQVIDGDGQSQIAEFVHKGDETHERLKWTLFWSCPLAHPTIMLRRAVLTTHKLIYPLDYPVCEDFALWFEMSQYTKLARLGDIGLRLRWHGENISFTKRHLTMQSMKKLIGVQYQHYTQHPLDPDTQAIFTDVSYSLTIYPSWETPYNAQQVTTALQHLATLYWTFRPIVTAKNHRWLLDQVLVMGLLIVRQTHQRWLLPLLMLRLPVLETANILLQRAVNKFIRLLRGN